MINRGRHWNRTEGGGKKQTSGSYLPQQIWDSGNLLKETCPLRVKRWSSSGQELAILNKEEKGSLLGCSNGGEGNPSRLNVKLLEGREGRRIKRRDLKKKRGTKFARKRTKSFERHQKMQPW
uniref:Uncharacterized protein n=1 Tax=Micrurus corallinus TaxID=54390 RepID=A0A2D4GUI1_MICCO